MELNAPSSRAAILQSRVGRGSGHQKAGIPVKQRHAGGFHQLSLPGEQTTHKDLLVCAHSGGGRPEDDSFSVHGGYSVGDYRDLLGTVHPSTKCILQHLFLLTLPPTRASDADRHRSLWLG